MSNLLPLDEINNLKVFMETVGTENLDVETITDDIFDILLIAYMSGIAEANRQLGTDEGLVFSEFQEAIYKEIDGKTYIDRVKEHVKQKSIGEIVTVADTEAHRVFNTGSFNVAKKVADSTNLMKTWETMEDERVRETHDNLLGVKIPFDERFHTTDGDSARFPGDFETAEENANCRCFIVYSKN